MLRRLVILFIVLLSAVTISTVAIGVADKVVPTCEDGHTWDLALVTEQATCTEEGKLTKTCKVCGETEDIVMDALGHDLVAVAGSAKEPSCEEDGYTGDKECLRSGCSYIEEGEVIPADGHDYDKVVTAPTCEEDGYTTYTCDCGKSYIADEVDALGHAYGEWTSNGDGTHKRVCANDTAHVESGNCAGGTATCQELAECSVCGGEYGNLLAHTYNQEVATDDYLEYAANCQSPATYFKSCVCGAKGTETFTVGNPGDHNYDREVVHEDYLASVATCTEPAKYFYTCVCGQKGTETFSNGEALGHRDTEVNITAKAPTCTEAGCTEGVFCNDCNTQIKESESILALGHSPATAVKENEVAATCTNAGSYDSVVYCSVSDCGVELSRETKTIDALGHKGSTEIANKCANCDHVFSVSEIIEMANALESNETLVGIYELTAVVKEITYASATPSIDVTLTDGTVLPCFKAKGTVASSLVVGDTVTLKGTINNYNGTVQFNQPEVVASKHTVTVEQTENGTTSVNVDSQVARGETVIITATPDTDYEIDNVIVNENPIQAVEGVYSFVVEKATIVKVTYKVAGSQGEVIASTLILKHNSSTTTNMNGGENEANDFFGLDENEWSVIASKGSASNNVGLNAAGDFRLYFNTNGSNTLTVSSTKYTIQTISMAFTGNSYSNVSVKVNGQLVTAVDGVYTINANEFVLGNANTSNVQVRIKNVEIKYVASSSEPTCEHTNKNTTQENVVNATCTEDGSYEEVVTCDACGEELSRTHKTINKTGHTPEEDDGDCTTDIACSTCGQVAVEGAEKHTPNADDGDCTTAVTCSNCSVVTTEAKDAHTPNADDGDCTTAVTCSNCSIVTTEAKASHTGGTATCKELAKCTECGTAYGSYASHNVTFTEGKDATCTEDGNQAYWACSVCSKNFKEEECLNVWDSVVIDALNHIDEDNNKICDRESCKQALCDEDSHILVSKNDENYHWQECSACKNVFDKEEHTYNVTIVDPTCTTDGYTLHECDCEYSYQSDEVSARHTPNADDGDCTTAIKCTECGTITTEAKASHTPEEDDGDCTTDIGCSECDQVAVEGAENHTPNADDGDCTTAITCSVCGTITTEAKASHTPEEDDGDCTTDIGCSECDQVAVEGAENHTPNADDGDCTTAITCSVCGTVTTAAKASHTPEEDDDDCTTDIGCSECDQVAVEGAENHTGGTATCEKKAECTTCGKEYGALGSHTFVNGTCSICSVPVVKTATLSFADTSSRESLSDEQQIWKQNGITFTNNRESSQTPVADYSNPARFYKSSTLTIEAQAMVKIVFNCNTAAYATELQTSIGTMEGVTVSISEKAVTVAFSANRDSFTVTLSGQVRMDSIDVTTSLCAHANKTNVGESKEATCTETGLTAGEKCFDCGYILTAQVATPKTAHDYVDGECSACGAADPSAGGSGLTEQMATINTAGTTGTLANDSSSISWNSGDYTITNQKGSAAIRTSDSDHYRVYANSTLVVSGSNITKVVLTATSGSYATVLGNSLTTEGATVSVSGSVVTVTVDSGMLNEIEFKPTAQTRIKSVVITYMG